MSARMTSRPGGSRGVTLIELLVSMLILSILTTMILGTWFVLQGSASSASQQSIQRDDARQALSRLATELRDAQSRLGSPAITTATGNSVTFSSTYNNAGNEDQGQVPHIVRFRYIPAQKAVYRMEDTDDDGSLLDETNQLLLSHVVNGDIVDSHGTPDPVPVFTYSYYADDGDLMTITDLSAYLPTSRIITVHVRLLVDVKPNKSPTFMDLSTAVQPRNLRN